MVSCISSIKGSDFCPGSIWHEGVPDIVTRVPLQRHTESATQVVRTDGGFSFIGDGGYLIRGRERTNGRPGHIGSQSAEGDVYFINEAER